jgi:hypothetical protein
MSGEKNQALALSALLPASIIDLITRELAFQQAREKLLNALVETRLHQKVAQETRPPFMLLQRAAVRREIKSTLEGANDSIELLERGIAKLDHTEHQLTGLISHRIEIYLRNRSDAYVLSLIGYFHRDDWQRLETRIGQYASNFQAALAALDKVCDSLPRDAEITLQAYDVDLVLKAVQAAQQFEREISFINRLSDTQGRQLGEVGATLQRQIALDWSGSVNALAQERVGLASITLKQLIAKHDELSQNALQALKLESHPAHFAARQEPLSYHARQWEMMRTVVKARFPSADLHAIAEETEQLLESGYIAKRALQEDDSVNGNDPSASLPVLHAAPQQQAVAPPPVNKPTATGPLEAPALRLRTRKSNKPPSPAPPGLNPAQPRPETAIDKPSLAKLSEMKRELARQQELLQEEKAKLKVRVQVHAENEARLRASLKLQQEHEAELEQRAQELSAIEAQLRQQEST